MGRIVYAPLDALTVTTDADQDIWLLAAPATDKLLIHAWELSSEMTTGEVVRLRLMRRTGAGSGGSAATEVKRDPDAAAIVGAVTTLVTTPGAASDILQGFQWEQLGPVGQVYTPEMRPVIDVSTYMALNLQSAVASSRVWSGWICWEEGF